MSREFIEMKDNNVKVTYKYKFDEYEKVKIWIYQGKPKETFEFDGMWLEDLIKILLTIDRERKVR